MTARVVIKIYLPSLRLLLPNLNTWLAAVTPYSARGRALGGPMSFLFLGQFLSPIVTRLLAEVVGLTTAFVWVGAVIIVCVVSFGLAAVIMAPASRIRAGVER